MAIIKRLEKGSELTHVELDNNFLELEEAIANIDVPEIVDALTSIETTKGLSANQGKILKGFIDDINTLLSSNDMTLDTLQEIVTYIKANSTELDTLSIGNIGGLQVALDSKVDKDGTKVLSDVNFTTAKDSKLTGIAAGAQVNTVVSVAGRTGVVALTKTDVQLPNVDDTSDLNKPVSTATQTAIDGKVEDNIVNGVLDKASSQNAVHDVVNYTLNAGPYGSCKLLIDAANDFSDLETRRGGMRITFFKTVDNFIKLAAWHNEFNPQEKGWDGYTVICRNVVNGMPTLNYIRLNKLKFETRVGNLSIYASSSGGWNASGLALDNDALFFVIKRDAIEYGEKTIISLGNPLGSTYNLVGLKNYTTYTFVEPVVNGYATVLINAPTQPTVTGATWISGATFQADTDMEMVVESKDGENARYFFLEL